MLEVKINAYRNGSNIANYTVALSDISISYSLSAIPTLTIALPIECNTIIAEQRTEIYIEVDNCIRFLGITNSNTIKYTEDKLELSIEHIIAEWKYEYVQNNLAVKGVLIPALYNAPYNLGRNLWSIGYDATAGSQIIEYLFSNENKLEALSDIIKQTEEIEWRIPINNGTRYMELGEFGLKTAQLDERKIISVEKYTKFDTVYNRLRVTAGNIGNGTGQMTLRHFLLNPALQNPDFPVSVSALLPNTDETYNPLHDDIKTGANDDFEYVIDDIVGIADANGEIFEKRLNLNDFYPIPEQGQIIQDADREAMYLAIQRASIRYLKRGRKVETYQIVYSDLDCNVNVGDKIGFSFDRKVRKPSQCEINSYIECEESVNDEMYLTDRQISYNLDGQQQNTLTLSRYITDFRVIEKQSIGGVVKTVAKRETVERQKEEQRKSSTHTQHIEFNYAQFAENAPFEYEYEVEKDLQFWYSFLLRYRVIPIKSELGGNAFSIDETSISVTADPNPLTAHTIPASPHGNLTLNHTAQTFNVTPNPHTHLITYTGGFANVANTFTGLKIYFDEVDLTPQLIAQYPTQWADAINNYNNYGWTPTGGDINEKYDLIEASKIIGNWDTLGLAGKHRIKIECDTGFGALEVRIDAQYSHTNR